MNMKTYTASELSKYSYMYNQIYKFSKMLGLVPNLRRLSARSINLIALNLKLTLDMNLDINVEYR